MTHCWNVFASSVLADGRLLEFGRDGMPMYIEGPHDDTWRIVRTLRQNVGDGNFHYLAGLQP